MITAYILGSDCEIFGSRSGGSSGQRKSGIFDPCGVYFVFFLRFFFRTYESHCVFSPATQRPFKSFFVPYTSNTFTILAEV